MLSRKKIACKDCLNLRCPARNCSKEHIEMLSDKKNQIIIRSREHIFREDTPILGLYIIQDGKAKVTSSDLNGHEQIIRLAIEGDILGHMGNSEENYGLGAVALTDIRVCFINNQLLDMAFKANYEFLNSVMRFYSNESKESELRSRCLSQMNVEEKVVFSLLCMSSILGFDTQTGEINVAMGRSEIAALARTNADQVSRSITSLKKLGLIETVGNRILIKNHKMMRELISGYGYSL